MHAKTAQSRWRCFPRSGGCRMASSRKGSSNAGGIRSRHRAEGAVRNQREAGDRHGKEIRLLQGPNWKALEGGGRKACPCPPPRGTREKSQGERRWRDFLG